MTRIEELKKEYPNIPPEIIVKFEVLCHGIKDGSDLDKVSAWTRDIQTYQSYDHDTLQELAAKRPEIAKPGAVLRPPAIYMKNGVAVRIMRDSKSPYEIRELGSGQFALFEGEEKVDMDICFPPPKARSGEDPVTSRGTPISSLVYPNRRCFKIVPVRFCEYFASGEECRFCNFNPTQEDASSLGLGRSVTTNLEDTVEAYKIRSSEVRLIEGKFEMGGFVNSETEANINVSFVEKIASGAPYKPTLGVQGQAMTRKDYQRLKDAGLNCITLQIEVLDPQLFPVVCPGKARHMSYERWLEAFHDAVDVFDPGHVGGKLVAGVTVIPPNGHKTWQDARDYHIEANRWLIKNGVFPAFTPLRWAPGSPFSRDLANREKVPPSEYCLDVAQAHHAAMMEYGLYEKLNKFLYCGLHCVEYPYSGEIGMIALAGNLVNWMADVVPYESNWMAQFLEAEGHRQSV